MPIEKLRPSFTLDDERIEELRNVVPEAFADGKIDWETLRELLDEHVADEEEERFGLFWPGKRKARRLASEPSRGTLVPHEDRRTSSESGNLFIEGDNLEVLKLLKKSYFERVRMIYIDPPYNTGTDLIYEDDFSEPLASYLQRAGKTDDEGRLLTSNSKSGGRFHSQWLNMMYPRLQISYSLLENGGILFVSIDDNELHNLRHLLDETFGEENFIGVMKRRAARKTAHLSSIMSDMCDYVVIYGKGNIVAPLSVESVKDKTRPVFNAPNKVARRTIPAGIEARCKDGKYKSGEHGARSLKFELLDTAIIQDGRLVNEVRIDGPFRINQEVLEETVYFTRNFTLRRYLTEEEQAKAKALSDLVDNSDFYNEKGSEEVERLFKRKNLFSNPKPHELIKFLIDATDSNAGTDDFTIMDFFAGSGSTAQAVMEHNFENEGNKKFILVQIPEVIEPNEPARKSGYDNIAELCMSRIDLAVKEIKENAIKPERFDYNSYCLTKSNFKDWEDYVGKDLIEVESLFDQHETPLIDGWKRKDLLSEVLLMQGYPLDSNVEQLGEFKHNEVLRVTTDQFDSQLFVCLDEDIADETIASIDVSTSDSFVCLDSALTDEAKMRLQDATNLKVI
jgi:adenine-specific DNA-methyltransferase